MINNLEKKNNSFEINKDATIKKLKGYYENENYIIKNEKRNDKINDNCSFINTNCPYCYVDLSIPAYKNYHVCKAFGGPIFNKKS